MTAESTRERILGTAFQLFHEQGYHATGIATILREAGLNPGSMYHAFPGKDSLLLGVLEYALQILHPVVMRPVEESTRDPLGRVFALMAQYRTGMVQSSCRMGCPMGNLALEVSDGHPEARALIHANFANWTAHVRRWLDDAGERLPASVDRDALARFVLTVMEGGLMQARAANTLAPFDESIAMLRDYFTRLEATAGRPAAKPVKHATSKSATKPASKSATTTRRRAARKGDR